MSRLSRAVWRCVPLRLTFRPDGEMTRFGRWSLRRMLRKMPRREFIAATEHHEVMSRNSQIHADYIARVLSEASGRELRWEVRPIDPDRPAR